MGGKIFVIHGDGSLQSLNEQEFATEDDFQSLLEKYPDLLPGDQINEASPRRWLLVSREFGVPDTEGGADRWALDHLFLDQDAIPTLVEIKRRSDARLTSVRREVVGQMMDYAANAVVHWPVAKMRAKFEAACQSRNEDAVQVISNLTNVPPDDAATEEFWNRANANLQAGRIRLIFVADHIPFELKRIVEFLNRYMEPVEVLAVELRHFAGNGPDGKPIKTLVPQVVGKVIKSGAPPPPEEWTEERFFQSLEAKRGEAEAAAAKAIYDWAAGKMERVWGRGGVDGSYTLRFNLNGVRHSPIVVWTTGHASIQFQYMKDPPFDDALRHELLAKCNAIIGVALPKDSINRCPSFRLSALVDDCARSQFITVLDWMFDQLNQPLPKS